MVAGNPSLRGISLSAERGLSVLRFFAALRMTKGELSMTMRVDTQYGNRGCAQQDARHGHSEPASNFSSPESGLHTTCHSELARNLFSPDGGLRTTCHSELARNLSSPDGGLHTTCHSELARNLFSPDGGLHTSCHSELARNLFFAEAGLRGPRFFATLRMTTRLGLQHDKGVERTGQQGGCVQSD